MVIKNHQTNVQPEIGKRILVVDDEANGLSRIHHEKINKLKEFHCSTTF
ncbi:MAG: hypothetical protein WBZ36_22230 [Candidatus Nitrosopolaris sp.]